VRTLTPQTGDRQPVPRARGEGLGGGLDRGSAPWVLAGAVLVLWGLRFGVGLGESSWFAVADVLDVAIGIAVMASSGWLASSPRARVARGLVALAVVMAFLAWAVQQIMIAPAYATDELAFDQYAAHLVLHGVDPYRASMAPAFARYQVSPDAYTLRFDGQPVTQLSYPALAFLAYLPLLAVGVNAQAGQIVDIASWAVAIALAWWLVRPSWRPLALVLTSLSAYVAYAVGGVTDTLFVPLLIGAAALLERFVEGRRWGWVAPALLGVAMAVKQTPWLVAPFLLVVVWRWSAQEHGTAVARARAWRFVAIATLSFAVWQVPFVVADPRAWLAGILTPFDGSIVPDGQGLVALTLGFGVGGSGGEWLSLLSIVLVVGGLVALWEAWPGGGWLAFVLPVVALFFATRSFGSYFVNLVPPALVAMSRWPRGRAEGRRLRVVLAACGGLVVAGVAAWALSNPPLEVRIMGVHTSGQLATVDRVTLEVDNVSGAPQRPVYVAALAGSFSVPWVELSGPAVIAPHSSARVELGAPNFPAEPSVSGGFQIVALAGHAMAPSALYEPGLLHLALIPDAVNKPVPLGQPVLLRAELLNRFDESVHEAGVPVFLGQIIYAQRGLLYASASINGSAPGATPVEELTNPAGIATFVVVDRTSEPDPVSFEANLVSSSGFYPYGYSQIVPIRFAAR